ncbi:MAG: hypothetical protein J1F41_01735 [Lachnospiraceae bacterium]|nr:hypothetical protein [Lachnospiraceae bacterium]
MGDMEKDNNGNDTKDIGEQTKNTDRQGKNTGRGFRGFLHFLQHISAVIAAVSVFSVIIGSTVVVSGMHGDESYSFHKDDGEKIYEDSRLFHTLYEKAAANVIRFGVIRSQLETDGQFNGRKVIDVTAYNHREDGLPRQYVTARYYLEDLLKWQKYGFEYSSAQMTNGQLWEFLNDKTMLTTVDQNSQYYNTTDAGYLKSDIDSYTFVDDVSSNMLPPLDDGDYYDEVSQEIIDIKILTNRYKTADDLNIEDYTSDPSVYTELCSNVQTAAENLAYNYKEYLSYQEYYDQKNTNVRYYIEKTVNGKIEYYTNMQDPEERPADWKYLYYSPSEMIYETNSLIEEESIRKIVKEYDYAYPENIKIWIGVDTSYPANDAFLQAAIGFRHYQPYLWQWVVAAVVSAVLYLMILIYLTFHTGKETDEGGVSRVRLSSFDKVPTEGALILAGLTVVCIFLLLFVLGNYLEEFLTFENVKEDWFKVVFGCSVLILEMLFSFFFYSLVRRIRAGVLWKNSFLKRLVRKISLLMWDVYDNGSIIVRTWIPYILFLLFNFLAMVLGFAGGVKLLPILFAFVVDLFVGGVFYLDIKERQNIVNGINRIAEGDFSHQIEQDNLHGDNLTLAKSVNSIGNGIKNAVEISMKDERMKADLITNVSHDIKTPLTSIINYVDLIKREEVDNERVRGYIKVLDEKSQRLKQLTDDLVEASKISSGNINLHFEKINLTELLNQTIGEFSEKFEQKSLTLVMNVNATSAVIEADSRSIWRVMENLFNNIYKYALEGTRVYIAIDDRAGENIQNQRSVEVSIKNISAMALNCNPEELTERFIRGDESRTTEGSGLGLSIAKNLIEAQHGTFEIQLDGDLFKVILTFPAV